MLFVHRDKDLREETEYLFAQRRQLLRMQGLATEAQANQLTLWAIAQQLELVELAMHRLEAVQLAHLHTEIVVLTKGGEA